MRAVAILAVVLNHLWPTRLTGGYVGVDVFFVISGFLITSHLVREATRERTPSTGIFLRPAVLAETASRGAPGTHGQRRRNLRLSSFPRWTRAGAEIMASAGYVENWYLSAASVNYSAINDQATVAQHYWSLSVEEQFYLDWPLLLLTAWWWAARKTWPRRVVAAIALGVVVVTGIIVSVLATAWIRARRISSPTPGRGSSVSGGLLALIPLRRLPKFAAQLFALAGFAAIAMSAVCLRQHDTIPRGLGAPPGARHGAVIAAGTVSQQLWHSRLTSLRPVQWLGDVSYSLYLWHWPLIVLAPFAFATSPSTVMKISILCVALVLAWLTYRFVERPGQRWRLIAASNRRTFLAMLAGMASCCSPGERCARG